MKSKIIWLTTFLAGVIASAQTNPLAVTSFEKAADLAHFLADRGQIQVVNSRAQFGSSSLLWAYNGGGTLTAENLRMLPQEASGAAYSSQFPASPAFVMSVYNASPVKEALRVEFNCGVFFDLNLNFKGWRTVWVPFYEMQGKVPAQGAPVQFSTVRFVAPASAGQLWLDDLVFAQYIDDRHSYPDLQVPFIKNGGAEVNDHWMPKIGHWEKITALEPDPAVPPSAAAELETVRRRLYDEYYKKPVRLSGAESYRRRLTEDGILAGEKAESFSPVPLKLAVQISPIRYELGLESSPVYIDVRTFGTQLLQIANEYHSTPDRAARAELRKVFAAACRYSLDQGWCAGSSLGTMHHYGYQLRELLTAFFLMKDALAEEGLLNDIRSAMLWVLDSGEMRMPPETFESNLDYYNTQSAFRLMAALLSGDPAQQSALVKTYSAHLSYSLALTDSTGGFKPDGTAWHHWGHYPAYATGAFDCIPDILYALSGTRFRIAQAGHANFKKAMMAATIYSHPFYYGLGQAGRHPLGGSIRSLGDAYLKLALSGTPDGAEPLDAEAASACLRLWGQPKDKEARALFARYKLDPSAPNGHWTFPYAALSVHRRADWSVNIKGYSRNVWASEIYAANNRYGRYQSSGVVQILPGMNPEEAGYNEMGWDWNHPPGATAIERSYAELEPKKELVMFKSEETYAGGCALDGNGVWAMKLNEKDGFTIDPVKEKMSFPGNLHARKSVFCFGDRIFCLGSGIRSDDPSAPVHTVLFQTALRTPDQAIRLSGLEPVSVFPFDAELAAGDQRWLMDATGNAYQILDDSKVIVKKRAQESPGNKYSIWKDAGSGKPNKMAAQKGNFALAWINHGAAPTNAGYAYVIYPQAGAGVFPSTAEQKPLNFRILRKDNRAHIVEDFESGTTAYACFESGDLNHPILHAVSKPCYVMIKKEPQSLRIAISNPDINAEFNEAEGCYEGSSKVNPVTLTLAGRWKVAAGCPIEASISGTTTTVTVPCVDGLPMVIGLRGDE